MLIGSAPARSSSEASVEADGSSPASPAATRVRGDDDAVPELRELFDAEAWRLVADRAGRRAESR